MPERRLAQPMTDRTRSLFSRLLWVTWNVISRPRKFFSSFSMSDSRWVSYLYGSTLCGLIFVFLHVYSMVLKNELPDTVTQLVLIVFLDYFSILLFLPLSLLVFQLLVEFFLRISGEPFNNKTERRTVFNILSYSTASVVFSVLPTGGYIVSILVFLVFSAVGIKKNSYLPLWKIIYSLSAVLIITLISVRFWLLA